MQKSGRPPNILVFKDHCTYYTLFFLLSNWIALTFDALQLDCNVDSRPQGYILFM